MNYLLYTLIDNVFNLFQILILVRAVLSWMPHNQFNQIISIIYQVTEYILKPIRNTLPFVFSGIDFSPIIAFLLIGFIKKILLLAV